MSLFADMTRDELVRLSQLPRPNGLDFKTFAELYKTVSDSVEAIHKRQAKRLRKPHNEAPASDWLGWYTFIVSKCVLIGAYWGPGTVPENVPVDEWGFWRLVGAYSGMTGSRFNLISDGPPFGAPNLAVAMWWPLIEHKLNEGGLEPAMRLVRRILTTVQREIKKRGIDFPIHFEAESDLLYRWHRFITWLRHAYLDEQHFFSPESFERDTAKLCLENLEVGRRFDFPHDQQLLGHLVFEIHDILRGLKFASRAPRPPTKSLLSRLEAMDEITKIFQAADMAMVPAAEAAARAVLARKQLDHPNVETPTIRNYTDLVLESGGQPALIHRRLRAPYPTKAVQSQPSTTTAAKEIPTPSSPQPHEIISEHLKILRVISDAGRNMKYAEIFAASELSEKTAGPLIQQMLAWGWLRRPECKSAKPRKGRAKKSPPKSRKGVSITDVGVGILTSKAAAAA